MWRLTPPPRRPDVEALYLTPAELRLVVKLAEANDSGDYGRRQGALRTRVSLLSKLYTAVDSLAADETNGLEESDAQRS